MRLHVDVTADDIREGVRRRADACMIHRALMRATEGGFGRDVVVRSGPFAKPPVIAWADEMDTSIAVLPEWVQDRANAFDRGEDVAPFAFDIDVEIPV